MFEGHLFSRREDTMNPDMRFMRLFFAILLLTGFLVGRILFRKKPQVITRPAGYTEQIQNFNGTPVK